MPDQDTWGLYLLAKVKRPSFLALLMEAGDHCSHPMYFEHLDDWRDLEHT